MLAAVCAELRHFRYDGGAMYRLTYRPVDVSTQDAFHPSVAGLARWLPQPGLRRATCSRTASSDPSNEGLQEGAALA